jgi:adenine-specific DNA-methyltransferase
MPPSKKASKSANSLRPTPVSAVRHHATRTNIPTEELRDFVADDEKAPKTVLYPRDPSLDPQLVWKGKDEQDQQDLAVPAVPIYIQEKIQPQAIIENIRANARKAAPEPQMALFSDFNGISFEELIDFYHHEQHWSNRMILGDSLMVMSSLAEKEGLKGKVQMIYMDPPYGIKFGSNWQVSTRKRDVKDGKPEDTTRQPEQIKAFRDTWQLGVNSYLSYLRDRLTVARELLTESGSTFLQIGSENVHLVRCLMDEVFGSDNFIELIAFRTKNMTLGGALLEGVCDYLIWYAKNKETVKYRGLYRETTIEGDSHWNKYLLPDGQRFTMNAEQIKKSNQLPEGAEVYQLASLYPAGTFNTGLYQFAYEGQKYDPPIGRSWKSPIDGMERLAKAGRIEPYAGGTTIRYVLKLVDYPVSTYHNIWDETPPPSDKVYAVQTSNRVIERCLLMSTDPGDLVIDPTCGSGTTAYVAEQWGRRWITVDTSRVAIALARTRLMAGRYAYYLLADSPEGAKKERELVGTMGAGEMGSEGAAEKASGPDIRRGFVYKRVPHVTLKSIANNDEIDALHAEWQTQLEPVRAELNKLLKQSWEEWQVPREANEKWTAQARELHAEWWRLRQARQSAIDASIARHADTELLYDQPYEDNKRIRVSGPFTVESLSPHRVITTDEGPLRATNDEGTAVNTSGQFTTMILENLKTAGVQNTVKQERLKFDRLEPFAGTWLQAAGEYTENGQSKRVAVSIGPEHGTVSPEMVKDAAKEAVEGVGFDLLVVCGFAFDPHVSQEVKRYGKLTVLPAHMNPDLAMGDELLKKTGAGNLFMVFGEPDLDVKTGKDGRLTVEIKGVDVYDPTTGEIRSNKTDDIACWFIDTDYNGDSFFVRHAYFTGADEPYEKLQRALRAEIDEAAWSALYSTKSYPFDKPSSGKIAVKVINHYGDEVLKVYLV